MQIDAAVAPNFGHRRSSFLASLGVALLTFLLLTGGISLAIKSASLWSPRANVVDYRVVACAERLVRQGADVYRTGALRDCEHGLSPEANEPSWSVTPFALPPYSAALLLPFGFLDFELGRTIWFVLLVLALCITVAATAQIVGRPAAGVALVLIPTFGLVNIFYGETVLLAVAAVALAALALERDRPDLAALAIGCALIEPAIGLPPALGLFVLVPRARRSFLACITVLALLGIATLGLPANLEYALQFIPAHEHAEIFARDQYSLTRLAYVLGAGDRLAALLGSISYIAAVAIGIVCGRSLGRSMRIPALYVLMPLAMSMLGGPFVHDYELAAALPATLVLARNSNLARVAVAMLTVVWSAHWKHNLIPAVAAAAGVAILYLDNLSVARRAAYTVVVAAAILSATTVLPKSPTRTPEVVGRPQPAVRDTDLSSLPWEWRIRLSPALSTTDAQNELEKIPFWFALVCLPFALSGRKLAARQRVGSPAGAPAITSFH